MSAKERVDLLERAERVLTGFSETKALEVDAVVGVAPDALVPQ